VLSLIEGGMGPRLRGDDGAEGVGTEKVRNLMQPAPLLSICSRRICTKDFCQVNIVNVPFMPHQAKTRCRTV
jgi:hypothetical protein